MLVVKGESLAEIVRQIRSLPSLRTAEPEEPSSVAQAKIVNLVNDPFFEDRLGNSPRKAARPKCDLGRAEKPAAAGKLNSAGIRQPLHQPTTQG